MSGPTIARWPVICGPTAGGKTELAIDVALALGGEVVSADALQIYRGLDIGTAKPTPEERRGVPHHLIDLVEPGGPERFTVSDWLARAEAAIADIAARGRVPVVVGGTHLYIKALLEGLFEGPEPDSALRAALQRTPLHELRAELERVDPQAAARIHPNDARRTIRAIEVFRQTGRPITAWQTQWDTAGGAVGASVGAGPGAASDAGPGAGSPARGRDGRFALVGLVWPVEEINRRINARVRGMVERGLVEEARALWRAGKLGGQAGEALGYKQLLAHFEGRCTLEEAIERIKIETRRLGKAQRTWMNRLRTIPGSTWIDAATLPRRQWVDAVAAACS